MSILSIISLFVVFVSVINLIRMTLLLIGSDIYNLHFSQKLNKLKKNNPNFYPTFSVVIPAYNEEHSILKTICSVLENGYPKGKFEVIVVDDGSTDNTAQKVADFKKKHNITNLKLVLLENSGKANALNIGMRDYAKGELVMCLDGDSFLEKGAMKNAANYFQDSNIFAVAANVKIKRTKGFLNLLQLFEYIICYQMKRGQTIFNIEYIIGGIGSTFRKDYLDTIGYYDSNTVTEDIDLTMKMLQHGNKLIRVIYASDVITYTQSVLSVKELIRQRYRWKWGRYQTFWKNKHMFFSRDKKFTKGLSWIYLPYALYGDIAFLLEPIVIGYILYLMLAFHDFVTFISAIAVISFYIAMNIVAENFLSRKEKLQMVLLTPFMYFFFYVLSYVEYFALIKSLTKIHTLVDSINTTEHAWEPVKRAGYKFDINTVTL